MTRGEAEKLLGGHATGTLTEAERRVLFEAALSDQALFDALADEEALRELLADPAVRARLLAALAPRVVPLWRRPGVLGVAAGLLVAGLAGLATLRSPALRSVPPVEPAPAPAQAPVPAPPSGPATPVPPAPREAPRARKAGPRSTQALPARPVAAEAAPAPALSGAAFQALPAPRPEPPGASAGAQVRAEALAEAEAKSVADRREAARAGVAGLEAAPRAKAARAVDVLAMEEPPAWGVTTLPDGSLRVTVRAAEGRTVLLLRRGASGVAVVRPVEAGREGPWVRWWLPVRPTPGEVLDLYILDAPPADPAALPADGPVAGVRVRVPVPEKKPAGQ